MLSRCHLEKLRGSSLMILVGVGAGDIGIVVAGMQSAFTHHVTFYSCSKPIRRLHITLRFQPVTKAKGT